ncbi:MAG TPA: hypothetical protein P5510_11745 [Clostridia bacterium]|nr:hypothetical protein [Clostridia bacterium]
MKCDIDKVIECLAKAQLEAFTNVKSPDKEDEEISDEIDKVLDKINRLLAA